MVHPFFLGGGVYIFFIKINVMVGFMDVQWYNITIRLVIDIQVLLIQYLV